MLRATLTNMRYVSAALIALAILFLGYLAYDEGARIEVVRSVEAVVPEAMLGGPATLMFTGDLMLDRGVASHARVHGDASLFKGVAELMRDSDAVVVNLETTLTGREPVAIPNGEDLRFTSDPRFASMLYDLGARMATLSNNHTDDFGVDGLVETRENLAKAGIDYYGSPANVRAESTGRHVVKGKTVCYAGYEGFIAIDPAPIAEEIRFMRPDCDFIVATMHAGEEYEHEPSLLQQNAAHAFVDAGADLVIGTHPHIVQPLELYKGKPIFYSLGNFIFDQDFSWNTTHGLLVRATLGEDATYELIPIQTVRAEASLITDSSDEARLFAMLDHSSWSDELRTEISAKKSFTIKQRAIVQE